MAMGSLASPAARQPLASRTGLWVCGPSPRAGVHHALIIRSPAAPSVSRLCSSSRELGLGSDFIRLRDEHPQTDRGLRDKMCHFGHLGPRSFPAHPCRDRGHGGLRTALFPSCPIFKALT